MTRNCPLVRCSLFLITGVMALTANAALAQDSDSSALVGVWEATAETNGGTQTSIWTFEKSGDALSGHFVNAQSDEQREMSDLSFKSNKLMFAVEVETQGMSLVVEVEAKLENKQLEGEWIAWADGNELGSGTISATKKKTKVAAFDGTKLDSFRGYRTETIGEGWSMKDGVLHMDGTKNTGDLITKSEYGDFELEFDWKISEGGNSGVIYRASLGDNQSYMSGPEYQVLDDGKQTESPDKHSSAALYGLYAPENKTLKPVGEWNSAKIVLRGNSVEHWLNGKKVVQAELGSDDWNQKVADSKFKDWAKFGKNNQGHICFQDHGNPVWYRNIKIRPLGSSD